ncbi:MAG: hypothetical protein NVSMB57_12040 [Actinomycetota bacterium]
MHERYGDQVAFYVIYIKEAHPEDGWVVNVNRDTGIVLTDATTDEERAATGMTCTLNLQITMPVLLDAIDNTVASVYGGWPDRLYLIGRDGRIAFQGAEGPFGFKPHELEAAISQELSL